MYNYLINILKNNSNDTDIHNDIFSLNTEEDNLSFDVCYKVPFLTNKDEVINLFTVTQDKKIKATERSMCFLESESDKINIIKLMSIFNMIHYLDNFKFTIHEFKSLHDLNISLLNDKFIRNKILTGTHSFIKIEKYIGNTIYVYVNLRVLADIINNEVNDNLFKYEYTFIKNEITEDLIEKLPVFLKNI